MYDRLETTDFTKSKSKYLLNKTSLGGEMNHIRQIEILISIILSSFELQINTLGLLGKHRMRPNTVHNIKQLVQAVLNTINSIEREFFDEVEGEANEALADSATLVKTIAEAREEMPEMEVLKELCNVVRTGHDSFTASLAKEEQRVTTEVAGRFALMKKLLYALLSRIDKM